MSIRIMTKIWDSGAYSGGTLLVLLALADFAGDDGKRIFPHVETLANKARLSIRATQMALETLKTDGVLKAVANATGGRGKSVEYEMDLERVNNLRDLPKGADSDTKGCNPQQERVQPETERVQSTTSHIDNHQEPSREPSREPPAASPPADASLFPDLPSKPVSKSKAEITSQEVNSAFDAYNEAAVRFGWGECQSRNEDRRRKLKQRLRDSGGVTGWDAAIEKAEASDFCMGRAPPRPGHPPFRLDFDTLVQQSFFVKLMEGKYDNREGTGSPSGGGGFLAAAARRSAAHPD